MSPKEKIISAHIPKTGGSSLRKFWMDLYGADQVCLYSVDTKSFHNAAEDGIFKRDSNIVYIVRNWLVDHNCRGIYNMFYSMAMRIREKNAQNNLPEDYSVVHGHFSPSFIKDVIGQNEYSEFRVVTVIREPLERCISGYFFLRKLEEGGHRKLPDWYVKGMNFKEFAFLPEMTNYQYNFLGEFKPQERDVLGITSNLRGVCDVFDPNRRIQLERINETKHDFRIAELDFDFIKQFEEENREDYDLYNYARSLTN